MRERHRHERGVATALGAVLAGVLALVALTAAGLTAVLVTHRVAQAGADLAALAGATAAQDGRDACRVAAGVAAANRTRLDSCRVDGFEVEVRVVATTPDLPVGSLDLPARARAGPVAAASD